MSTTSAILFAMLAYAAFCVIVLRFFGAAWMDDE
jgi:hypothetical protein